MEEHPKASDARFGPANDRDDPNPLLLPAWDDLSDEDQCRPAGRAAARENVAVLEINARA